MKMTEVWKITFGYPAIGSFDLTSFFFCRGKGLRKGSGEAGTSSFRGVESLKVFDYDISYS